MLTDFGRYLRKIRIDCGELIRDMAARLEVTASYLSAVETGKRNIPSTWVDAIAAAYHLDARMKEGLAAAAARSSKVIKLHLDQMAPAQKETAILFAREFNELDDAALRHIREILKRPAQGE